MSAAEKLEAIPTPAGVDPDETVKIMHFVPTGSSISDRSGQTRFNSHDAERKSVSHLLGSHEMTFDEACKIYLDAREREVAAKKVREYWGAVVSNWSEMTETKAG